MLRIDQAHTHTHAIMHAHTHKRTCAHTHTHTHRHVHTHRNTHTHTRFPILVDVLLTVSFVRSSASRVCVGEYSGADSCTLLEWQQQ